MLSSIRHERNVRIGEYACALHPVPAALVRHHVRTHIFGGVAHVQVDAVKKMVILNPKKRKIISGMPGKDGYDLPLPPSMLDEMPPVRRGKECITHGMVDGENDSVGKVESCRCIEALTLRVLRVDGDKMVFNLFFVRLGRIVVVLVEKDRLDRMPLFAPKTRGDLPGRKLHAKPMRAACGKGGKGKGCCGQKVTAGGGHWQMGCAADI